MYHKSPRPHYDVTTTDTILFLERITQETHGGLIDSNLLKLC